MPSLFSRSNTLSGKHKDKHDKGSKGVARTSRASSGGGGGVGVGNGVGVGGGVGEFGALPSGSRSVPAGPNPTQAPLPTPPTSPSAATSPRVASGGSGGLGGPGGPGSPAPLLPPKHVFLPTHITHRTGSDNSIDSFKYSTDEVTGLRPYGFLGGVGGRIVLGLEDAGRVVTLVGRELESRGLTTPMLFSNQALELNQTRTKILINAYIDTLSGDHHPVKTRVDQFAQDLRFAREHELAWLLRWALARVTRVAEGTKEVCHGVLEWDVYEEWRGRERAANYPSDAFPFLASLVVPEAYSSILSPLFRLLSRLAAHSHLSGLTPHALSSLFAPLLFDIPTSSPALVAHATYVRAACATEHLLLAYIRSSGSSRSLGTADLPGRLKEWVTGYPAMLASDADLARGVPRRGAKVVRCERATRTVRAYSKDLVMSAELWAGEVKWDAFDRIFLRGKKDEEGRPKFSTEYRRRMCVKETPPLPSSAELRREVAYGESRLGSGKTKTEDREKQQGDEAKWGSLAGKEWSMFEEGGFDTPTLGGADITRRLEFDLNETAKQSLSERRRTMDWTEFASPSGGFNRTDPLLDVTLAFSPPISESISHWPQQNEELRRRLHKAQKDATPFHYDTAPRVGVDAAQERGADAAGRVFVEEGFVDVWADLMMGAGWMDREELTFKEANWTIVEYKAKPRQPEDTHPRDDPRTSDLYFLLEERVPVDYQLAVADPKQKRAFSIFSPKKKRAANGGAGTGPTASGWQDSDFDRMLLHRSTTKKLTLSNSASAPTASVWHMSQEPPPAASPVKPVVSAATVPARSRPRSNESGGREKSGNGNGHVHGSGSLTTDTDPKVGEAKGLFFAARKTLRRRKSEDEKLASTSPREQAVDFELQSASGISSAGNSPEEGKREEEKWMDILIANGARRMERQDAPPPIPKSQNFPKGLPVTPHPPRHVSPAPPGQALPIPNGAGGYHTPETSGENEHRFRATEGDEDAAAITPRQVAFPHGHDPSQPSGNGSWSGSGYTNQGGHGVPSDPYASLEPYTEHEHDAYDSTDGHGEPGGDVSVGPNRLEQSPEILSPVPRRRPQLETRDTIHGIVDTYRDSIITATTDMSNGDGNGDGDVESERRRRESGTSVGGGARDSGIETDGESELEPPGMVFDLTPGREPSPARYRHGEPLQFVGEEPEDEEY